MVAEANPKHIFITGASSGLGAALALGYAQKGAHLFLCGRNHARLEAVAEQCEARGATTHLYIADVRDAMAMQQAVHDADARAPLHLVVANAGVSAATFGATQSAEEARGIFDVNVMGVLNAIHPAIEKMRARGAGQLAIMSSLAAYLPVPDAAAYAASKAALLSYGEALHIALKPHGIHVSVVCPGFVDTALTRKNTCPMPALMEVNTAANRMICGLRKRNPHIAFPKRMALLMRALQFLPFFMRRFIFTKIDKTKTH